jgi:ribonuclease T1
VRVSSRRSQAIVSVVVGVAVILGYLVWTWTHSSSTTASSSTRTTAAARATTTGTKGTTRATAGTSIDPETKLPWIEVADLPSQGRSVLALIDKGGPYPYSQDGGTFTNAEKLLPLKANGFYTEYTVKLPSSSDRGPVRIIMGGKGQWYFWTDDHYASFSRIRR